MKAGSGAHAAVAAEHDRRRPCKCRLSAGDPTTGRAPAGWSLLSAGGRFRHGVYISIWYFNVNAIRVRADPADACAARKIRAIARAGMRRAVLAARFPPSDAVYLRRVEISRDEAG